MTDEEIALRAASQIRKAPILHESTEGQDRILSRIILAAIKKAKVEFVKSSLKNDGVATV